jgi:hypothetical protein
MAGSREIGIGPRLFVFLVYLGLGSSFVATAAILIYEFWGSGWFDFATTDSHLFLFFPTLGIVALLAFYTPSCALTDLYWRHVPLGKLRFAIGMLLLGAFSYLIAADLLASPKRSAWEIAPAALKADKGDPPGCALSAGAVCERLPVLQALKDLRQVSQTRLGLAEFIRDCDRDALLEGTTGTEAKRFCFASTRLSPSPPLQSDADCCRAQERLSAAVSTQFAHQERRSLTAKMHAWLLPLKVFFLLVLLAISMLLVLRHNAMEQHYKDNLARIEFGVIVGTAAVLFFPFMSQAFVQSSEALFGVTGRGTFSRIMPVLSLAFGAWTLLMVFFFYRRRDKELEAFGKLGSAVAAVIAVLQYTILTAIFVRVLGSGANAYTIIGLLLVCVIAAIVTLWAPWDLIQSRWKA